LNKLASEETDFREMIDKSKLLKLDSEAKVVRIDRPIAVQIL